MRTFLLALIALLQVLAGPPPFPHAEIFTAKSKMQLPLPDPEAGYYRGTRFDWSGSITNLTWNNHTYFGKWFEKYDPQIHDSISGPVEEFLSNDAGLGYDDAKPGESFVRIGVGAVRKPDEPAYRRFATYDIVDPGTWRVDRGADWIEFTHRLSDTRGYAYLYRKKLRLEKDTLVLEHRLENTGEKTIETSVYDHNFFTIDGGPTGPEFVVSMVFEPRGAADLKGLAEVRGNEIRFLRQFKQQETVFTELQGFGTTARDYDFRVENRRTGAGVRVTGDRPLSKLLFWSAWQTVCPEPYIDMRIEPGKQFTWRITYEFYEVAPSAASARDARTAASALNLFTEARP